MGVSWTHRVTAVCREDEREWLKTLPDELTAAHMYGETPVHDKEGEGRLLTFSSSGYGIFDLNTVDWPASLIGVVHRISPNQCQDFDVVDSASAPELYGVGDDEDVDDLTNERGFPPYEGCDIDSEYWTDEDANAHLNALSEFSEYFKQMPDQVDMESDESFDSRYQAWCQTIEQCQEAEYKEMVDQFLKMKS